MSVLCVLLVCICCTVPVWGQTDQSVSILIEQGNRLRDKFEYDRAIEIYQRVLKQDPQNVEGHYELLHAYLESGNFDKSLETAVEASHLQSNRLNQFNVLTAHSYDYVMAIAANYENLANRSREEIDEYIQNTRQSPDAYNRYFDLALGYWSMNRLADATDNFQRAVLADSDRADAHLMLGRLHLLRHQPLPAMLALLRFLILEPTSVEAPRARLLLRNLMRTDFIMHPDPNDPGTTQFTSCATMIAAAVTEDADTTQALLTGIPTLCSCLDNIRPGSTGFTEEYYLPYFSGLTANGFVEPLVHYIMADDWSRVHPDRIATFLSWSRSYPWRRSAK